MSKHREAYNNLMAIKKYCLNTECGKCIFGGIIGCPMDAEFYEGYAQEVLKKRIAELEQGEE